MCGDIDLLERFSGISLDILVFSNELLRQYENPLSNPEFLNVFNHEHDVRRIRIQRDVE